MHPNATAPAVPAGPLHPQPSGYANASNRSDLLPKVPDEEDLDVNTDIYSKVMVTVIYLALFLVGTVGNSITAYTLVRKKSLQNLQSTVHYHLASLAFSDLLIFLLCMPIELYNFIWVHHPWAFGGAVCKGYYFLRDACTYATALNIASLSVERYMAICHPFKAKSIMSRSRTKKFISCIWIASFLLAIPMIFTMGQIYGKDRDPDSLICTAIVDTSTLKTVIQVRGREARQHPPPPAAQTLRRQRGGGWSGDRLRNGDVPGSPDGTHRFRVRSGGICGSLGSACCAPPRSRFCPRHAEQRPRSGVNPAPLLIRAWATLPGAPSRARSFPCPGPELPVPRSPGHPVPLLRGLSVPRQRYQITARKPQISTLSLHFLRLLPFCWKAASKFRGNKIISPFSQFLVLIQSPFLQCSDSS